MNKALFIATIESHSGKSLISMGLLRMMLTKSNKVGYFKPVVKDRTHDTHIQNALDFFKLDMSPAACFVFDQNEIVALLGKGKQDEVLHKIIDTYKKLEARFDYVLVEGGDFFGEGSVLDLDLNLAIAKNLGIPALLVGSGKNKPTQEFVNNLQLAYQSFEEKEVDVIGLISNKILKEDIQSVAEALKKVIPATVQIDVIPENDYLDAPTVKEICEALNGKVLFGTQFLNNSIGSFNSGAMQLRNYLTRIKDNALVVTPGDRADLILGALQANASSNYPKIAGIVLTGDLIPEPSILSLIEGVQATVPILSVAGGTFEATNKIGAVKSKIYASNTKKILLALDVFDSCVNAEALANSLTSYQSEKMTPNMFQYNMLQKVKQKRKHIVLPEGNDKRILQAAARLQLLDLVDLTLLGNRNDIQQICDQYGLQIDTDKINILNPEDSIHNESFVQTLVAARKHKGMTKTIAKDLVKDVSYFGTLMVLNGLADGMVSGAAHTTQHTIKPALQLIKTKPGVPVVSSVFFMCLPDRVSVMGDCAVNPNPDALQLAEIASSSAFSAKAFGIEPKIAMLSYSSGSSGKGEEVEKVRTATELVQQKHPDFKIEGPIQYDAAVDPVVAKTKMPNSKVAGEATVLIFPDLNTGNNTYKAIQRETGALAIGPMLQGLNKPVNDLSRGCTVEDIYNTILLTAIQAQQE